MIDGDDFTELAGMDDVVERVEERRVAQHVADLQGAAEAFAFLDE